MADYRTLMVNVEGLEEGKFYHVFTESNGTTLLIPKNDYTQADFDNLSQLALDNQQRINGLEDADLKDHFMIGMNLATIKKQFSNQQHIEIPYLRKEVTNVIVYGQVSVTDTEKIYKEITSGIDISYHELYDNDGSLIAKKVIIETEQPITGYALVL